MSTPIKITMSFLSNHEEFEDAKRLGISEPKMIFEKDERYIFKDKIIYFNRTDDGGIRLDFVSGDSFSCDYEDSLWSKLTS